MKIPGGHDYDTVYLRPSQIKYGPYQRKINNRRVERIAKKFDGDVFNMPEISFRDGCYWCVDGQHTIAAWQAKFGDKPLPCKVYRGMTYTEEAALFAAQNGESKTPTACETFKAQKEAGDMHVTNIIAGAEAAGYEIGKLTRATHTNIVAVDALTTAYDMLGRKGYTEMLRVIKAAWPDSDYATGGNIIGGMAIFFKTYYGEFKNSDLVKSLRKPGAQPLDIIQYAKSIGYGKRKYIAKAILAKYNFKRTANRLQDRL